MGFGLVVARFGLFLPEIAADRSGRRSSALDGLADGIRYGL
jgi:hypothetical protein